MSDARLTPHDAGRWFEQRRMEWIAETLDIFGFISRKHLVRKFNISIPQAANDFRRFMQRNPDAMHYDNSRKMYVAGPPHRKKPNQENGDFCP